MSYFACSDGVTRWGRYGAAGVLFRCGDRFLVQHRGEGVHVGNVWGIPGGALDSDETPEAGALREAAEEIGFAPEYQVLGEIVYQPAADWAYTTVVVAVAEAFDQVGEHTWESTALRWVTLTELRELDLHPGLLAIVGELERFA